MANITSPYESVTFGNSLSLRVDGGVGAVSINPSGRDVVLAGYVLFKPSHDIGQN